jgi:hypothetical protein
LRRFLMPRCLRTGTIRGAVPMSRSILAVVASLMAGAVGATPKAIDAKLGCRTNPALVAPCFELEGTVQAANGTPTFRIYKRGTNRILGISGGEQPIAPRCLAEVASFERKVDGKFIVCPFSPDRPGHMRMVCVDEVVSARVFESAAGRRGREVARLEACRIETPAK